MNNARISICLIVSMFLLSPIVGKGQTKIITTIAGSHSGGYSGDGLPATLARLNAPYAIAADAAGNVYIADQDNNAIRKIDASGIITTFLASLHSPSGIAVDRAGNVYVANSGLNVIQKISSGVSTIVAGGGTLTGLSGDGGPATLAALNDPQGIALDAAGNLYIADMLNSAVRMVVAATGKIYNIAGTGTAGFSSDGGAATATELYWPEDIVVDSTGDVFISDFTQRVREVVAATGKIYTVAGEEATYSFAGYGGPATSEGINPVGLALDAAGNLYIADASDNRIRQVNSSDIITTIAGDGTGGYTSYHSITGSGTGGYSGDGGPPDSAELYGPTAIAFDANGNMLITDPGNEVIRKIVPSTGIYFSMGGKQSLAACENQVTPINSQLAVVDTNTGETVSWSVVASPMHGVLTASYTAASTGGTLLPSGLYYTPAAGYIGTDSFSVKATNGGITIYTAIQVTINTTPSLSITAGYTTICNGSNTTLFVNGDGTPGGGDTLVKQNFNASISPWTVDTTGTTGVTAGASWTDVPNGFSDALGVFYNPDSTPFALANAYGVGAVSVTKSRLISPSFSLAGYEAATLFFDQSYKNITDTSAEVDISTNGGATWTTLVNYALTYPADYLSGILPFLPMSIPLSLYAGYTDVRLRFYYNSYRGRYWAVDNIAVVGYPTGIDAATWSPVTNLFTNTGFTDAYSSGAYRDTVYVHPTTVTDTTRFTYFATESIGSCSASDSIIITVTPDFTISGRSEVCAGAYDTLADYNPYGGWTVSNTDAYINFLSGVLTGITAGLDTVTYRVTTGSCAGSTTFTVAVSAAVPLLGAITGDSSFCASTEVTLSDTVSGGVWNSSNPTIAAAGSTGLVTGVTAGTAIITYLLVNGCGSALVTKSVTVNPLPTAGSISGVSGICAGAATTFTDPTIGGTWSSSNTSVATVGTTGSVADIAAGTAIISYTVSNSCGSAIAAYTITVNPLPTSGSISGASGICAGAATSFTDPTIGGAWSSSNISVATIGTTGSVAGVAAGTAIISYTVSNSCGSAIAARTVTVNPLPTAGSISGASAICAGAATSFTDPTIGGTWSSSNTSVATIGTTGSVAGIAAGTAIISYTVSNSCGSAIAAYTVTVNPLPSAGSISGASAICAGAATSFTDPTIGGTWSSSNTSVATVGTTGSVAGVAAGTAIISYTVSNSCGSAIAAYTVTVNPLPTASSISGASGICAGAATSFTDPTIGGTWSSSNTSVATIGTTGSVAGIAAGTAIISYTVTNSCGSAIAARTITVNPLPTAGSISGASGICAGAATSFTDPTIGGTWSSSNTSVATVGTTGSVAGVAAGTAIISYTVSNSCGSAIAAYTVTVNPLPTAGSISGASGICAGAATSFTDPTIGGTWSSSNTSVATIGTTGSVAGVAAGTAIISYTVTNSCGSAIAAATVTINPLPYAGIISGIDSLCPGDTASLTETVGGGVWAATDTLVNSISSRALITALIPGYDSVTYTVTVAGCSSTAIFPFLVSAYYICPNSVQVVTGSQNAYLSIYPNPNTGSCTLTLLCPINEKADVTITNVMGEQVKFFEIESNVPREVNLRAVPGVYLFSVTGKHEMLYEKVIITN